MYRVSGDSNHDHLAWSLSRAGDVDGDGFDDFIAGTNQLIFQLTPFGPGFVRVYSGRTGLVIHEFVGDNFADEFGISVGGGGDVDADGVPDIIAGASQIYGTNLPGYARVFSGKTGAELWTFFGDPPGEVFGRSVALPGDLNQDGHCDVLVGIPGSDIGGVGSGTVRAYSGEWITSMAEGRVPSTAMVLYEAYGSSGDGGIGVYTAPAGLVDADGVPDFVTSVPQGPVGIVQVHSGKDGSLIWLVNGPVPGISFGQAIAGIGDLDGDGRYEVAIGAELFQSPCPGAGCVWIHSGADGTELVSLCGADPEFVDLDCGFGSSVAGVGDLNADGVPDVAVGARVAGPSFEGAIGVISGEWIASTALGKTPATSPIVLHLEGENSADWFGFSAAELGDVNADGVPDFGVGAVQFDTAAIETGALYVYSGAALSMASSDHMVSLGTGGTQLLTLDAPTAQAGDLYLMLGSATGTKPGVILDGLTLPLNLDGYTTVVAQLANQTPFLGFADFLDGSGDGAASFTVPAGLDPSLAGVTLDHAFVAIDLFPLPVVEFISNPVPVSFVP